MKILVATDFSTRSNRALRQAGVLARFGSSQLYVVHVVDDDQPEELIRIEGREAERLLAELMSTMLELQGTQCRPIVIIGDPFDGILRAAKQVDADLIVMGAHRKHLLLDIFVGTTIERVIRKGSFPVLMVNNEAQRPYERVLASVDMSDASKQALRVALSTGFINNNNATLLHAFLPSKGKLLLADSDQASIDRYVASERQQAQDEFATFLVSNELHNEGWSLRIEEGRPMEVISRAISEMRPDLLVMGTYGRSAFFKVLIGSVTEEALCSLGVDILVVPPVKKSN